ncbi:MAG: PPC domain-containing protein [Candidatus Hydrogenedentes bacterium]|nr:PPC domain-containing protein [Candidatus Hydrogenedentota bacterium]
MSHLDYLTPPTSVRAGLLTAAFILASLVAPQSQAARPAGAAAVPTPERIVLAKDDPEKKAAHAGNRAGLKDAADKKPNDYRQHKGEYESQYEDAFKRGYERGYVGGEVLIGLGEALNAQSGEKAAQSMLTSDEALTMLDVKPGATKVINKAVITGYKTDVYGVSVPKGATLRVEMTTKSKSAYFNVVDVSDKSGAAVHRGEVEGPEASVAASVDGTYLIRPFLESPAAKRGEKAEYGLKIQIDSGTAATTPSGGAHTGAKAAQALLTPDEALTMLEIASGATKVISKGYINGYNSDCYGVDVPKGSTLHVEMTTTSTSAYFNVIDVSDTSGAALHRGEVDGSISSIDVNTDGTYLIRPFLVKPAAKNGEKAEYSLKVKIIAR